MAVARDVMARRRKALGDLADDMAVAERIMREDRDLLAELAK